MLTSGSISSRLGPNLPTHIPNDVTHYWPIDEGSGGTAFDHPDANGSPAMDLTINGATWSNNTAVWNDYELTFDGSNDSLDGVDQSTVRPGAGEGFTFYIEMVQASTGSIEAGATKGNTLTTSGERQFGLTGFDNGSMYFDCYTGTGTRNAAIASYDTTRTRWGCRYIHGSDANLWKDGTEANVTSASGDVYLSTEPLTAGEEVDTWYLGGAISEMAYFDHALTDSEMADLTGGTQSV